MLPQSDRLLDSLDDCNGQRSQQRTIAIQTVRDAFLRGCRRQCWTLARTCRTNCRARRCRTLTVTHKARAQHAWLSPPLLLLLLLLIVYFLSSPDCISSTASTLLRHPTWASPALAEISMFCCAADDSRDRSLLANAFRSLYPKNRNCCPLAHPCCITQLFSICASALAYSSCNFEAHLLSCRTSTSVCADHSRPKNFIGSKM